MDPWYEELIAAQFIEHDGRCAEGPECHNREIHVHSAYVTSALRARIEKMKAARAAEIRKAKAEALREASRSVPFPIDPYGGFDHQSLRAAYVQITNALRDRADQIEARS